MAEHYTKSTVQATAFCDKCRQRTMHRVDNGRKGPCLRCVGKLEAAVREKQKQDGPLAPAVQRRLIF